MIARGRYRSRHAAWLLAAALLAGPAVAGAAAAPRCEARTFAKDGWTRVAAPQFETDFGEPSALTGHLVLPGDPDTLFVTNGTFVMRSSDGGCTWDGVLDSFTMLGPLRFSGDHGIVELDAASLSPMSQRVYVLARQVVFGVVVEERRTDGAPAVYVSDDGGRSFRPSGSGLPLQGEPLRIRVADGVDGVAYVAVRDERVGGESLYVTRDAGRTWSRTTGDSILPGEAGSMIDFAVDPGRPDQVWAWNSETLFLSTDAGGRFRPVPQVTRPVSTVEFLPRGLGRLSDVRVYHLGSASADASAPPYIAWRGDRAVGAVTSAALVPFAGVRLLGTPREVFTYYRNTRTGTTIGPVDISPSGADPFDLEASYVRRTGQVTVVGRTTDQLLLRDPTFPPPPLPPISRLDPCFAGTLGAVRFGSTAREVVLRPGETRRVAYDLSLPPVPSDLDVNFMLDTTGSMAGVIAGLRQDVKEIVDNICAQGVPVQFGLADFREYPGPWSGTGAIGSGTSDPDQYAYKRRLEVSPVGPELREAISALDTGGGATDASDSALEAVYQAATGLGRRDTTGRQLIPFGLDAGFRAASLKVVVLATDTAWREATPGYPGPSFDTVVAALRLRGIKVVGLAVGERGALSTPDRTNRMDLERIAAATRTMAPPEGTDCDADGAVDVAPGEPLVCVLRDPGAEVVSLGPAMTGLLAALQDLAAVSVEVSVDPAIVAPGGVLTHDRVDVRKPSRLRFDSVFHCDDDAFGRTFPVLARAVSRGRVLGTTELTVRCAAPLRADPVPPPVALAPVVAAVVPPPPPPPAPVPATQTQPHPNPNPNPQPNVGFVGEEQEQLEIALAATEVRHDEEQTLAMSMRHPDDASSATALTLAAITLSVAAAGGVAMSRRPASAWCGCSSAGSSPAAR
ncbi:MAG TPA: hypothetical protein VNA12_03375 [Mycobacteriales bacterium]|nr:hypothetical protein [Mycobacteriales bacterium]